ncbi:MAG: BREX-1 system phosphatase PglZ type B [Thermoleophilia bacterium]|nr:BREX-1 system phosphatase PglZ type B [Thermoleophilia bacterium]
MSDPVTVLEHVEAALRRAVSFDRNDRLPPAALLWPDKGSEWGPVVARLTSSLPIYSLGAYDEMRCGPAIWLRCVVDRTIGDMSGDETPIVYLPGFDRTDLRTVEGCPAELQAIAELQFRGALFGSRAGRDWTLTAFFSNRDEGLGIEVARDADAERAFRGALHVLLDEPVESLRHRAPLRAADLNALLVAEPTRDLLRWLNDPAGYEAASEPATWDAFVQTAKSDYDFSPSEDGPIVAAERLGSQPGRWKAVWERFAENPRGYPGVVERLRQARPVETLVIESRGSWPQDNEEAEDDLRAALAKLCDRPSDHVRGEVLRLEGQHRERRGWVWAELGQAPLAGALEHLATLASETERQLTGETPTEIAETFASSAWLADAAAVLALASVDAASDRETVEGVVSALYRPWADAGARRFQEAVLSHGADDFGPVPPESVTGECVLFTDGLRFDLGARLRDLLESRGLNAELTWQLAALPSLTATAKPAVSLAAARLAGGDDFDTVVAGTGQAVTAEVLRREIAAEGVTVVSNGVIPDPGMSGWAEFGNVDAIGHSQTDRFAQDVAGHVGDIAERIVALLESGWQSVRVVTDHGWLYVPGGLEKANLPQHLTVKRKGRAARLRDDAGPVDHPVVPWRWDPSVRIAVAPGLSCYTEGRVYEHGGLSPQECVTPVLTVRAPASSAAVSIEDVAWVGMRVRVTVGDAPTGSSIDVRTKAAAASASKLDGPVEISGANATALVADPDAAGEAAFVVVLGPDGSLVAQRATTIGGDA